MRLKIRTRITLYRPIPGHVYEHDIHQNNIIMIIRETYVITIFLFVSKPGKLYYEQLIAM